MITLKVVFQERVDKYIAAHSDLSRSRIQALIDEGLVCVDGKVISQASLKVHPLQTIVITIPELKETHIEAQAIDLDIVYEDEDIIIINKAAGMVVHPAPGNPDQTLVNALLAHTKDKLSGVGGVKRPGIVHRLDKQTSGLMVVAKNDAAHHGLAAQFQDHSLARTYLAFVWGNIAKDGVVESLIGRSPHNRQKMAVVNKNGKHAITHFKVLKRFLNGEVSLVECRLKTGRTHQIRVHMSHLGHPLLSDPLYGGNPTKAHRSLLKHLKELSWFGERQALHAKELTLIHPKTLETLLFKADLPADLQELERLLEGSFT